MILVCWINFNLLISSIVKAKGEREKLNDKDACVLVHIRKCVKSSKWERERDLNQVGNACVNMAIMKVTVERNMEIVVDSPLSLSIRKRRCVCACVKVIDFLIQYHESIFTWFYFLKLPLSASSSSPICFENFQWGFIKLNEKWKIFPPPLACTPLLLYVRKKRVFNDVLGLIINEHCEILERFFATHFLNFPLFL